jgi:putative FmdB family regulatory protein
MPIYAYRCEACGFAKDVLQKISDPQLTVCTSCGAAAFKKQVTAAGFQLKGTGWYVTDFRGGSAPATGTSATPVADTSAASAPSTGEAKTASPSSNSNEGNSGGSSNVASSDTKPSSSTEKS